MNPLRALIILGSRTEAIRLAALVQECHRRTDIDATVCLAGPQSQAVRQVLDYFGIEADVDLSALSAGSSHLSVAETTARCLTGLDQALARYRPDCVLAHGQAGVGAMAALSACYRGTALVHVPGYRQRENRADRLHRGLIAQAATLHCAATADERDELLADGVAADDVCLVGDMAADSMSAAVRQEHAREAHWLERYPFLASSRLVLVTDRCRGDFEKGLAEICRAVLILATEFPDVEFVLPIERNPRVRDIAERSLGRHADENVHLDRPLPYGEFAWLINRSMLIVTDSAAVRAEAPALGKPVLVTRTFGDRPTADDTRGEHGRMEQWVGAESQRIIDGAERLLTQGTSRPASHPYVPSASGAVERTIEFMLSRVERSSASAPLRIAA